MNRPRKHGKNLPQCVYLRHGAYWYVKRGKWTRLGATLKDALATYAALYESPQGTMPRVIAEALQTILVRVKPETARGYKVAAAKLSRMLAEFEPREVKPRDVAGIKVALADTPNMANRCLSLLRQVMSYALEQQLCESNPVAGIARHDEVKRTRLITADEYARIYRHAGPRLQVIMDLLRFTGQRIGDVLAIRRSDITDDGIQFRQQKTGKFITVRWSPGLRATVDRAKALQKVPTLTLLQSNRRGKPGYRSVKEQWDKACEAAGVADTHLHDLRAMALTQAKAEGKDATALAGHSSPSMTARYLRDRGGDLVDGPSFGHLLDNWTR